MRRYFRRKAIDAYPTTKATTVAMIVGTVPAFVAHYAARLHAGGLWAAPLEAVLGSETAQRTGLAVGSSFAGSHGLAEGGGEHGDRAYRVVGVLAPTGTVIDRLASARNMRASRSA